MDILFFESTDVWTGFSGTSSMKAFFYKTLTTVIDDFGSMIIPMPWCKSG
jgi:hypothetical protein